MYLKIALRQPKFTSVESLNAIKTFLIHLKYPKGLAL